MDVEPSPAGAVRNYSVIDAEEHQAHAEPGIPGWESMNGGQDLRVRKQQT